MLYAVFSTLEATGRPPRFFDSILDARAFFNRAPGNVRFLEDGKEIDRKEAANTLENQVRAILFWKFQIEDIVLTDEELDVYVKAVHILKSTNKGIGIIGTTGIYKTTVMDVISYAVSNGYISLPGVQEGALPTKMRVIDCNDLTMDYRLEGPKIFDEQQLTAKHRMPITLDDLGKERSPNNAVVKYYGDELDVLSFLIQNRYRGWCTDGMRTHFTSNLSITALMDLYKDQKSGIDRVIDRIAQMTIIISLDKNEASKRVKTII